MIYARNILSCCINNVINIFENAVHNISNSPYMYVNNMYDDIPIKLITYNDKENIRNSLFCVIQTESTFIGRFLYCFYQKFTSIVLDTKPVP
jgi:hypothetical protein